mgnify:CR=1 FL=1
MGRRSAISALAHATAPNDFRSVIQNSPMLFVVAAGNGDDNEIGYDIDASPVYPASLPFDNVITVAI